MWKTRIQQRFSRSFVEGSDTLRGSNASYDALSSLASTSNTSQSQELPRRRTPSSCSKPGTTVTGHKSGILARTKLWRLRSCMSFLEWLMNSSPLNGWVTPAVSASLPGGGRIRALPKWRIPRMIYSPQFEFFAFAPCYSSHENIILNNNYILRIRANPGTHAPERQPLAFRGGVEDTSSGSRCSLITDQHTAQRFLNRTFPVCRQSNLGLP